MASHKYTLLNVQNDDSEINLQFQDFEGNSSTTSTRDTLSNNQAGYFNSFSDSVDDDDQEQKEPKNKRMKTERETENDFCSRKESNYTIRPILSEELFKPVFVQLIVLEIKERKLISKAIQEISKHFPIPNLLHLKRVRRVKNKEGDFFYVILDEGKKYDVYSEKKSEDNLVSLTERDDDRIWKLLKEKFIHDLFTKIYLSDASLHPPRIRCLYEEVHKFWPCTFHEDLYLKRMVSDSVFSDKEIDNIIQFMNKAIQLSSKVDESTGLARAAVISKNLDFDSRKFYGKDRRLDNPLLHASMVAIDAVSKSQGGGVLSDECHVSEEVQISNIDCTSGSEYICTGFNIFLTDEPCLMCSMALLHSRIQRIFYLKQNVEKGGLSSVVKLHTLPGINHRFEVFQIVPKNK